MGNYYGYDPSRYVNDFSWIGDVGKYVGKFASEMPELIEMNKQIKENNKMKDVLFSRSNQFVDKLKPEQVTKIASSMGIDYQTPEEAKTKLREMIPKFGDKATNEEYAGQVVNSFFGPLMQHAQSNKAGAAISIGDLLNMVNEGNLNKAMLATPQGQEHTEEQKYQKEFGRKYGESGEVVTEQGLENKNQLEQNEALTKQKVQLTEDTGSRYSPVIKEVLSNPDLSAEQVYSQVFEKTNNMDVAKEAAAQRKAQEDNELKAELQSMRNEASATIRNQQLLAKTYDVGKIDTQIQSVESSLARYEGMMKNSKNISSSEKAEYTATINLMKKQLKILEKTKVVLIEKGGSVTPDEANRARLQATQMIDPEDEQEMIRRYKENVSKKEGGFSGGFPGRKDDLSRFKETYYRRFGKEAKIDESGNPVSQYRTQASVNQGGGGGTSVGGGIEKQKYEAMVKALTDKLNSEKDVSKIEKLNKLIQVYKDKINSL